VTLQFAFLRLGNMPPSRSSITQRLAKTSAKSWLDSLFSF